MRKTEPFILQTRAVIPPEAAPSTDHHYDTAQQIWINTSTGRPVVAEHNSTHASQFGETSITETREGADRSEVSGFDASRFGETTVTKTFEGHDQGESIFSSQFGETSLTATREGHDTREIISCITDATYRHF